MKARLGDDVIRCVGYGHVGDGNLHLNITTEEYDKNVMDKIEPFVYEWTARYNGSISAEHGKSIFLTQRINRKLNRILKQVFGIMAQAPF